MAKKVKFDKVAFIKKLIGEASNHIIGATFIKKDGSTRDISFRVGIWKDRVKGTEPAKTALTNMTLKDQDMIRVCDLQADDFRTINLNNIISMRVNSVKYSFDL